MTAGHRRRLLAPAITLAVLLGAAAPAAGKATSLDDYVRVARMLNSWRYEEARRLIARLEKTDADEVETRYLKGELAFLDGDYARALELIDEIPDDRVEGNVGALRQLAASTLAVTRDFTSRKSAGGHFIIFYSPGVDEVIVDLAGDVLEAAYDALGDDFGYRPSRPVRVELLSRPSDLARVSTLTETEIETTGTIALCKYNKLMVVSPRATVFGYPWMDTLVHEYVHYTVSRKSHDKVPVWLHEGLARYEQLRWRSPATGELSAMDEHLLATALEDRGLISFDDMHPSMAKLPSQEAAALAFAEVHTMVAFIHDKVGYRGLRRIIDLVRSGKSARRAVGETRGTSWDKVEAEWRRHLRSARLKRSDHLAGRARARIRFKKGEGNDENVGVEQVSSKVARKHTRLGGILRARGLTEAAAIEYEKALAIDHRDRFVLAKLSRTYLELQRYDRAIELAEPLAEKAEADAAPATTLGVAYLAVERPEDARQAFEIALRLSPFDPTVRCGLAEAYEATGQAALAARESEACKVLRRGH